jgi:hypothetical protein
MPWTRRAGWCARRGPQRGRRRSPVEVRDPGLGGVASSGSSGIGGRPAALRAAFSRSFSSFFFFFANSRWRFSNE